MILQRLSQLVRLTGIFIPRQSWDERRATLNTHIKTVYPEGEGPFPAILLFHGCGGPRQSMTNYAARAAEKGCAAVIVDSLTPRGIDYETAVETVCGGTKFWGRERAGDVHVALDLVRDDPKIDPDRLGLAGWSHGGWSILDALVFAAQNKRPEALTEKRETPFKGVKAIFLVYPYASLPALCRKHALNSPAPIHTLLVEGDTHASEADVRRLLDREKQAGTPITIDIYSGVTHGFEEPDHHPDSILLYDADATAKAEDSFATFFGDTL
jgi:dienelactone hydrolase